MSTVFNRVNKSSRTVTVETLFLKRIPAPGSVSVSTLSTSEVTVTTTASPDSPGVTVYKATLGAKTCTAPATGSASFTCTIGTLLGGVLHRVQVVACLVTGDCSTSTSGQGYTVPDSTFVTFW